MKLQGKRQKRLKGLTRNPSDLRNKSLEAPYLKKQRESLEQCHLQEYWRKEP